MKGRDPHGTHKKRGIGRLLAALGLCFDFGAALAWYYDLYIHWQAKVFSFTITAVIVETLLLGQAVLLTLLALRARGETRAALARKTALSAGAFALANLAGAFAVTHYIARGDLAKQAAWVALILAGAQALVLLALFLRGAGWLGKKHLTKKWKALLALILCAAVASSAALGIIRWRTKGMLSPYANPLFLRQNLTKNFEWFPDITDRDYWDAMAREYGAIFVPLADETLEKTQPIIPASKYLEYARGTITGQGRNDELMYDRLYDLNVLALAECMTGAGKYLDAAMDFMWAVGEEFTWCIPAHDGSALPLPEDPVIELISAETAANLAAAWRLLGPALGELEAGPTEKMVKYQVRHRILEPYVNRGWWWLGAEGNWNSWINTNILFAALVLEDNQSRRLAIVKRSMDSVEKFLSFYGPDGGCDEGATYWVWAGGKLNEYLSMLKLATGGKIDLFGAPLIYNIGDFVCKMQIDGPYVVNFGDANAKRWTYGDFIYDYGKNTGNQPMMDYGALLMQQTGVGPDSRSLFSLVRRMAIALEAKDNPGAYPYYRDSYSPDIEVMTARQAQGSGQGLYIAAKGSHNGVPHNHNDVGGFVVYADGQPVLVDAGVATYTKDTFSDNRYDIWSMQSAWHNLPMVNGVMQKEGREYAARDVSYELKGENACLFMDIAGAYPKEAGIETWRRDFIFDRGAQAITLRENFTLRQASDDIRLHLLTPIEPVLEPGAVLLGDVRVEYPDGLLATSVDGKDLTDTAANGYWGGYWDESTMYRIALRWRESASQGDVTLRIARLSMP